MGAVLSRLAHVSRYEQEASGSLHGSTLPQPGPTITRRVRRLPEAEDLIRRSLLPLLGFKDSLPNSLLLLLLFSVFSEEFWGHTHTKSRLLPFTLDQLNAAKAYLSSWVPEQPPKKKLIVSVGSRSNLFREESASRLPGVRKESKESAASAAAAAAPVPVQPVVMTKPQPHLHRGASNSALKNTVGPGGVPVEVGQHIESSIAEVQNKLEQERGRQGNKSNDREDDGDEDFEDFHTLSRVEAQSMHDEIEKEILDAWNEESQ